MVSRRILNLYSVACVAIELVGKISVPNTFPAKVLLMRRNDQHIVISDITMVFMRRRV